jgi:hypothetical protein
MSWVNICLNLLNQKFSIGLEFAAVALRSRTCEVHLFRFFNLYKFVKAGLNFSSMVLKVH